MDDLADFLDGLPHPALIIARDERVLRANAGCRSLVRRRRWSGGIWPCAAPADLWPGWPRSMAGGAGRELRRGWSPRRGRAVWQMTLAGRARGRPAGSRTFRDTSAEEQAEAMRRDFVANVSHELRTPLTALMGFIETLQGPPRATTRRRASGSWASWRARRGG